MEPQQQKTRRRVFSTGLIILFVICNALIGLVGGVAGFVLLSNSKQPFVQHVRDALKINQTGGVTIPVHQTVQLEESSLVIDAAKKVSPAVVAISASQQVSDFFGQVSTQETGGGSGFIITSDGLILTNKHVVDAANTTYKVVLNDGRILDAKIQAMDTLNDLAVIKVDAKDLPTVEFGSSDSLQIGQYVIAVGNALGEFRNSVTLGVVSAKQRSIDADSASGSSSEKLTNLIQTDAAINPGNSGGPMVNMAGQVVGINTAIASTSGGSIGIGFAIPIDSIRSAIDSVRKTGQIIRPYLGVRYLSVTPELQQLNNLSVNYGALISKGQTEGEVAVLPGSPADKAGIVENDILLEINGERIDEDHTIPSLLQKYNVGDQVSIKLLHQGKEVTVKVTLDKQS